MMRDAPLRSARRGRALAAALLPFAAACLEPPPLTQGSLEVVLRDLAPSAATLRLVVSGPEQRTLERAADGAASATVQIELLRPGTYTLRAQTLFGAGQALQDAERGAVEVEAGARARVELVLAELSTDAGAADAADGDRGAVPVPDAAVTTDSAAIDGAFADAGAGRDAAGEDATPRQPQPAGLLAPGFPVLWDGPDAETDVGKAVAVAGDAVWVAGSSARLDLAVQVAVWRLDRAGQLAASSPTLHLGAAGGSGPDQGLAIAVDGQGRAWVAGSSRAADSRNILLVLRLEPDGGLGQGFPRVYDLAGHSAVGQALALAPQGDVWIAGKAAAANNQEQLALWKLDADGALAPGFPLLRDGDGGGSGNDRGNALALDPDGSLWIAGTTTSARGDLDLALWHLDASGTLLQRGFVQHDSGLHTCDEALALAVTPTRVWLAGMRCVTDATQDAALWSVDRASGQLDRSWTWDDTDSDDELSGLAEDARGELWASGRTRGSGGLWEPLLFHLDAAGQVVPGSPLRRVGQARVPGNAELGGLLLDARATLWLPGSVLAPGGSRDLVLWKFE